MSISTNIYAHRNGDDELSVYSFVGSDFATLELTIGDSRFNFYLKDADSVFDLGCQIVNVSAQAKAKAITGNN